ncbi:hypothetical protein KEM52_004887 [Ascosphaera acerosa]|nr:hypothetical protein KEM52_004887 [Ascosphaera acerosa]
MTAPRDPLDRRVGTVGRALPHVRAKVVDPADPACVLPVGKHGELAVAGYLLMDGYWDAPRQTAEVMRPDAEGTVWMHSGDQAVLSADGYLQITGRIKDVIIRGGENIHPQEIERCLLAHPAVLDASVVGVPDERYGEAVAAFVVPRTGREEELCAADLVGWVAARLPRFMGI